MATISADIYLYDESRQNVLASAAVGLRMVRGAGYLPAGRVDLDILQAGTIQFATITIPSLDLTWPLKISPSTLGMALNLDGGRLTLTFSGPVIQILNPDNVNG